MKWTISDRCITAARKLMEEKRVVDIVPNSAAKKWTADVIASHIYHVELDGTAKENDVCQCSFWKSHGYCQHTVAVELALKERGIDRVMQEGIHYEDLFDQPRLAKLFMDRLNELQMQEDHQQQFPVEPLYLQPHIIGQLNEDLFVLELKIGYAKAGEHLYIVRNLDAFLTAYENSEPYVVNQKKTFYLAATNFSNEDQELLQLLMEMRHDLFIAAGEQMGRTKVGRFMVLTYQSLLKLLNLLTKIDKLRLTIDQLPEVNEVELREGQLPITAHLSADPLVLELNLATKYLFDNYHLLYDQGVFYKINDQQERLLDVLNQLITQEQVLLDYKMDELPLLCTKVLPQLEQVTTVTIDEEVQQLMVNEPLQVHFYLKALPSKILLRVDFQYGEVIFSSDPQSSVNLAGKPVLRDEVREQRVKQLIEEWHYREAGRNYLKNMPHDEQLYLFYTKEIPQMEQYGQVHLDHKLESLFINEGEEPKIFIDENSEWLDIRFDISGIKQDEVNEVLQRLEKKQSFYELDNGQILNLDNEIFHETSAVLDQLRGELNGDNSVRLPKYRTLQVKSALNEFKDVTFADYFSLMVEHLTEPQHFPVTLPKNLQAELRDYQFKGFQWMKMLSHYQLAGILADDMGLGKTLQTITFLLSEKEEGKLNHPALIVAPASLTYNWQSEIKRFAPTLASQVVSGTKEVRQKMIEQSEKVDILITSYASFRQDADLYTKESFSILILDEAQMVKNAATKTFVALKQIPIAQRFALSGTPIENNLDELWALFQMLMPGFFPSLQQFHKMDVMEVAKFIQPFVMRREKQMVLNDLPNKIETNMYSQLTDEQKKVYVAYLQQMQAEVNAMDHATFTRNRISILAGLTRLRQICCTPALFVDDYDELSGKEAQIKDLLLQAKENNRRVLIFSQFTSMLERLQLLLENIGISSFYLSGTTKPNKRIEMVDAFNAGERDVFLISLKAGGTGLNLTGADTVILFDLWWNPAVEEQAAGRAHRIGQKKVVEVWRLIAEGTIEEKMYELQQEKKELFDKVMNAEETGSTAQLTEEDIREILNYGME